MKPDAWETRPRAAQDIWDELIPAAPWTGAYALLWHQPPNLYIRSLLREQGIVIPRENATGEDLTKLAEGRMAYKLAVLRWAVDLHRSWVVWYEGRTGWMTAERMADRATQRGWTPVHHGVMPDRAILAHDQVMRHHFASIIGRRTENPLDLLGMEETWVAQMMDRLSTRP